MTRGLALISAFVLMTSRRSCRVRSKWSRYEGSSCHELALEYKKGLNLLDVVKGLLFGGVETSIFQNYSLYLVLYLNTRILVFNRLDFGNTVDKRIY